jgi:hypothetical protein
MTELEIYREFAKLSNKNNYGKMLYTCMTEENARCYTENFGM